MRAQHSGTGNGNCVDNKHTAASGDPVEEHRVPAALNPEGTTWVCGVRNCSTRRTMDTDNVGLRCIGQQLVDHSSTAMVTARILPHLLPMLSIGRLEWDDCSL